MIRPYSKFYDCMDDASGLLQIVPTCLLLEHSYGTISTFLGTEFETQQILNGKVDFLFPSHQAWEHDRRRCVIVSIKRSLRERYKQVFEELSIAQNTVYLFVTETCEEAKTDITTPKVRGLNQQNVYLVVRDEIKNLRFSEDVNVIGFTAFINEELPNHRARWANLLQTNRQSSFMFNT